MTFEKETSEYLAVSADFIDNIDECEDISDLLFYRELSLRKRPKASLSSAVSFEAPQASPRTMPAAIVSGVRQSGKSAVPVMMPEPSAPVIDTNVKRMTPANFRKSVEACALCAQCASSRKVGLDVPAYSRALVVLDSMPDDATLEYLDKIMSSIRLFRKNGGFAVTSIVKCALSADVSLSQVAGSCFAHVRNQISLICPSSIFVFGKVSCDIFRREGAVSDSSGVGRYGTAIPIVLVEEGMPLEIKDNKEVKHRLWVNMQGVEKFISLKG